jgi:hypothetical protein
MFFERKSQAAMEFLMTYGWAIMVILLALGALAYFGVLNPSNLLPEKCTFPTGFQCDDYIVNADGDNVSLRLINGKGEGVIIYNISLEDNEGYFNDCVLDFENNASACELSSPNDQCRDASDGDGFVGYNNKTGLYVPSSEIATLTINCSGIVAYEGKARADIHLTWYKASTDDTFAHTDVGELLAKSSS